MSNNGQVSWGTAAPAGNCALSVGVIGIVAYAMGFVPPESAPLLVAWLFVCTLVQVIAGIIEYKRGDSVFSFCLLNFGAILQGGAALTFLMRALAHPLGFGELPPQLDGWIWIGISIMVTILIPSVLRISSSVSVIIIWVAIACFLFALVNLGVLGFVFLQISCVMFLVFALYMFYTALAIMTNTVAQKEVFPLGGPIIKPEQNFMEGTRQGTRQMEAN